jgi:hypothetical protein
MSGGRTQVVNIWKQSSKKDTLGQSVLRENQGYSATRIIMIYSFMLHLRFLRVLAKSGNYNRLHYAAQMATC